MEENNVICSADKPFKYIVPTLEHMASVKLVLTLWSQRKSFVEAEMIREGCCGVFCSLSIYRGIYYLIDKLPIPDIFKKKLLRYAECFDRQTTQWYHYHFRLVSLDFEENPIDFYWTSRGSIDYTKTAEIVLRDERINLIQKYGIACTYCFENEIAELFSNYSSLFASDHSFSHMFENNELVRYWTMKTEDELFLPNAYNLRPPCINDRSLCNDRVLLHYWNNAGNEEKLNFISSFLMYDSKTPPPTQYIFYLLSKLDKIMLSKVLHRCGLQLLRTLLDDSFHHDYFFQIAALVRSENPDFDFDDILHEIRDKIRRSNGLDIYYVYLQIFDKLCEVLGIVISRQSVQTIYMYLKILRWENQFDRVWNIISCLSAENKQEILTCASYEIPYLFVVENQLDYLKEVVQVCLSTKNDIDKFKEHLIQVRGKFILSNLFINDKLPEIESFVEWITENDNEKGNKLKQTILVCGLASVVGEIKRKYAPQADFTPADKFLKWCLRSDEDIKNLKISIAENYVLRELDSKRKFNQELIYWLFESDEEKIEQFLKLDTPVFENILD